MALSNRAAPGVPYFTPLQTPAVGTAISANPPTLFTPLKIRNVTFQNRICKSPTPSVLNPFESPPSTYPSINKTLPFTNTNQRGRPNVHLLRPQWSLNRFPPRPSRWLRLPRRLPHHPRSDLRPPGWSHIPRGQRSLDRHPDPTPPSHRRLRPLPRTKARDPTRSWRAES